MFRKISIIAKSEYIEFDKLEKELRRIWMSHINYNKDQYQSEIDIKSVVLSVQKLVKKHKWICFTRFNQSWNHESEDARRKVQMKTSRNTVNVSPTESSLSLSF